MRARTSCTSGVTPQPRVDFWDGAVVVRDAKVIHPASNITREPLEPVGHRDPQLRELTVLGFDHPVLLLVDHEFEFVGHISRHAGLDAFTGATAFDEDEQRSIRSSCKAGCVTARR